MAHRFYLTLAVHEALRGRSLWETADRCQLHRGQLQSLLQSTAAFSAAVLHFCRQLDELWPFVQLLEAFNKKLATGAAAELAQLLELPAVKQVSGAEGYRLRLPTKPAEGQAEVFTDRLRDRGNYLSPVTGPCHCPLWPVPCHCPL